MCWHFTGKLLTIFIAFHFHIKFFKAPEARVLHNIVTLVWEMQFIWEDKEFAGHALC
jgi:hypothetical protein